jgi:hypothetical protein
MKRLPVAPLTQEDIRIWMRVITFSGASANQIYANSGFQADRRDAEKMHERMEWQAIGLREQGYDWRTERRGWFPSDWGRASDEYLNPL